MCNTPPSSRTTVCLPPTAIFSHFPTRYDVSTRLFMNLKCASCPERLLIVITREIIRLWCQRAIIIWPTFHWTSVNKSVCTLPEAAEVLCDDDISRSANQSQHLSLLHNDWRCGLVFGGKFCVFAVTVRLATFAFIIVQPFKAYLLRDAPPTSLTFNNCTLCPHCIYVFCIYLRTNSDLCHIQHKLIGFYNRDEKCLQRGTDWVFK